jgi:hypothetical protein
MIGKVSESMTPKCWYTWTVFAFLPILFVAGMAIQFGKTSKGKDHRRGNYEKTRIIEQLTPSLTI